MHDFIVASAGFIGATIMIVVASAFGSTPKREDDL
jgi:hypothetical protein